MEKTRLLIIDDEEQGRSAVQSLVEKYCPHIAVCGTADSKASAIRQILDLQPELITLDINLGDGTAFDVLKEIPNPPKTIFITAYDEFALKAFKYNTVDYLLKPFDRLDLIEAISKSVQALGQADSNSPEKNFGHFTAEKPSKMVVPTATGFEVLLMDDISHLEADNNYTTFHLLNGERKVVSKTLKHYEDLLTEDGFFRCHQSYLIRLNQIKSYVKGEGGTVYMQNGAQIDVSRRKKEELINLINERFYR